MRKSGVRHLGISDGADPKILQDASSFGSIGHAALGAEHNEQYLIQLAAH